MSKLLPGDLKLFKAAVDAACEMMGDLDDYQISKFSKETQQWITKHRVLLSKRRQRLLKKAFQNLTQEERKQLVELVSIKDSKDPEICDMCEKGKHCRGRYKNICDCSCKDEDYEEDD